jgi:hypothetical protein
VTAITSAINRRGGSEATILSLGNVSYHWGRWSSRSDTPDPVAYPAGGNPYGTSFATGPTGDGPDAAALEADGSQGRRLAQITIRLLGGGRVTDAAAGDGNARGPRPEQPPRPRERRVSKKEVNTCTRTAAQRAGVAIRVDRHVLQRSERSGA